MQLELKRRHSQQNVQETAFREQSNSLKLEIVRRAEPAAEARGRNASDQAVAFGVVFEATIAAARFRSAYRGSGRRGPL